MGEVELDCINFRKSVKQAALENLGTVHRNPHPNEEIKNVLEMD